jgi:hypothetical protein
MSCNISSSRTSKRHGTEWPKSGLDDINLLVGGGDINTRKNNVDTEDGCILGGCDPWSGRRLPTFQRCLLPPSTGQ